MKLLQIYPYYPPAQGFGGVLNVVKEVAERLSDRGHEVTVFTTDTGGPGGRIREDFTRSGSLRIRRFTNVSNILASRRSIPLPVGFRSAVDRAVDEFDVVHVHGFPHILAVLTADAIRGVQTPCVLTPHGTVNLPETVSTGICRRVFDATLGKRIIEPADVVTSLTPDERRRILKRFSDVPRVEQIPNGVDPDRFDVQDTLAAEFRRKHGLADRLLVMYIGRLHRIKGLDVLVSVAETLDDHSVGNHQVEFVIVGPDDGYLEEFQRQIRDRGLTNITLTGPLPHGDVHIAHSAADVFILPSYSEGQPISVLEALAASTPVVVSEACSLPEVARWDAGAVVSNDPEEVESALRPILHDDTYRAEMSRNARSLALAKFSWESVIDRLEDVYADVL
jgi:glycosyltransferase involved in cell wall biosynthesis